MADKKAASKERKRGVGTAAGEALLAGMTNEEALVAVRKEFPEAGTSLASINWYRNTLRREGKKVKTSRELSKERKAKIEKAEKVKGVDPLE